ncbi:FIST signal transduction protein [Emticicia sp. 21SJ11W-3]|uniref:FIST signal transduction protein n=1 Tax=Emticicia sp. 21SJ11W-3 TaxID=2916755 RepID=UPI00209E1E17|nr:FIST N-terminal domain-containing protein [Emticicia sp. 21SJ11W-3]UTA69074.1 FIST C-terminal domain-containing protein [Emticicia sp. 21SJ11W-3]
MKIRQTKFVDNTWKEILKHEGFSNQKAGLVLAFGERKLLDSYNAFSFLQQEFPAAEIIINSTSGEIYENSVHDDTIVVTAIEFEKTRVKTVKIDIADHTESFKAGETIAQSLKEDDLAAIIVISDGGKVNGSKLIEALNLAVDTGVSISGGLAGDAGRFEKTLVGLNEKPTEGRIVGIGLYGKDLKVGHGTKGGWDVFGPEREVTESEYNVLYKIGESAALDLYKDYLGKYAKDLPGAALLFPLSIRVKPDSEPIVRTILTIDEEKKSMTFAGELPKGAMVRFMKANFDHLVDASASAAQSSVKSIGNKPELALLISCVGRKLVLGQRIDEEVEAARDIFGDTTVVTGFYSYGEISPLTPNAQCELHNQTMTITTFSEN